MNEKSVTEKILFTHTLGKVQIHLGYNEHIDGSSQHVIGFIKVTSMVTDSPDLTFILDGGTISSDQFEIMGLDFIKFADKLRQLEDQSNANNR